MTKEFATSVVVKALRANAKPKMIHSDMGSQYTSSLFEGTLQNAGIDHSYSRKGHPYDNARIESVHSLIKRELIYHEEYRTIDDVRSSVEWYVNGTTTNVLIHALNGFKPPRPMFGLLNLGYRH
ncbi:transposase [Leuconostoc lactis]|nr:transposase [Leuconostoc lactis]